MELFQTVVFLLFFSGNCFSVQQDTKNQRLLDKTVLEPYLSTYQNRIKRQNPVQGYQRYVPAVQSSLVVMSSGPNSGYGGVPISYDGDSTIVIKTPNDVYNTRLPAYPNAMTRG